MVSEGIFPFKALLVAQGFHPAAFPGRLTVLNLDDPLLEEYIIHQSTQTGDFSVPFDPNNSPEFYHNAVFFDMDNDGWTDIVTVRSGVRVGQFFHPPSGDLVWFKNPPSCMRNDWVFELTLGLGRRFGCVHGMKKGPWIQECFLLSSLAQGRQAMLAASYLWLLLLLSWRDRASDEGEMGPSLE